MKEKTIRIPVVDFSKWGAGEIVDVITIVPQPEVKRVKLNSDELNAVIQEHLSYFQADCRYSLLLSAYERIMTCERFLTGKSVESLSEIEIITYFAVIAMLYDVLPRSYDSLLIAENNAKNNQEKNILKQKKKIFCCTIESIKTTMKNIFGVEAEYDIRDDDVIEFLRSLIFAHPCDTNRAGFLKKYNDKKIDIYSPWAYTHKESIILRIYCKTEMYDLYIPFSEIQGYVDFLIGKILELKNAVEKEANLLIKVKDE